MSDSWNHTLVAEHLLKIMPRFNRAIAHHMYAMEEEERATHIQIFTLFALIEEPMTASDIARRRNVSLQSVSTLVQSLVERGWVTRIRDPHDRRQWLLQVTDEGIARAEATKRQFTEYVAEITSQLNDAEIEAAQVFLPALEQIIEATLRLNEHECGSAKN